MDLTPAQILSFIIGVILILCVISAATSLGIIRRQLKKIISLLEEKKK